MTYKDYFLQANFNEVWKTLRDTYQEAEETHPSLLCCISSCVGNGRGHSIPFLMMTLIKSARE